jgi:hypothetical protein
MTGLSAVYAYVEVLYVTCRVCKQLVAAQSAKGYDFG